jgi:tetratricopeptide (TPR) repeat protein/predicted aspartyl protease
VRIAAAGMTLAAALLPVAAAIGKCTIARHAEISITMNSLRPIVPVQINGQEAHLLLDSGAFFSMMSAATAAQFKLKTTNTPFGMRIVGVGGSSLTEVTVVKELKFANGAVQNVEFGVAGGEVGADGLLGQNLLSPFDVEYDFEHGAVRLFRTDGCEDARLSYWLTADQKPSTLPISPVDGHNPRTTGAAYINGQKIKVQFDTGAYNSLLSLEAAARAGITPQSPGVVEAGYSRGVGRSMVKTYIGTFASFSIGDSEEIKNARLRFSSVDLNGIDMLLGADFFISHRVFVATKERKMFLSYSGGPVFNLARGNATEKPAVEEAGSDAVAASQTNAAEAARQGSALVARREFGRGLAFLNRAVVLSPTDPEMYFQRGNAYRAGSQADLALADYDQVIKLKSDFLPAYLPRAELQIFKENQAAAIADLAAADKLAAPQADLRFDLGALYTQLDQFQAAIDQYSQWIRDHENDSRYAAALARRCNDRAMLNQDLPTALNDCNAALRRANKLDPAYPAALTDRALVELRMGHFDKAIDDCSEALKQTPKNALTMYLRGIAQARKSNQAESDKDIAASKQVDPKVAEHLLKLGIAP